MKSLFVAIACCVLCCFADCDFSQSDSDALFFPGPTARSSRKSCSNNSDSRLAVMLRNAKKLSSLKNLDEIMEYLNVPKELYFRNFALESRFQGGHERSNAMLTQPANCEPELQIVPIKPNADPSIIYVPSCTRIYRCGGCCNHPLLSCVPTASEIHNFEVIVTKVGDDDNYHYGGKEIVPLEVHTECICDCTVKEEHCKPKQIYYPEECKCICSNEDEEKKCPSMSNKLWNPDICACVCRTALECSTGFYFDNNSCSCKKVSIANRWFNDGRTTSYNYRQRGQTVETPIEIFLDADDPRRKPKDDPEY